MTVHWRATQIRYHSSISHLFLQSASLKGHICGCLNGPTGRRQHGLPVDADKNAGGSCGTPGEVGLPDAAAAQPTARSRC